MSSGFCYNNLKYCWYIFYLSHLLFLCNLLNNLNYSFFRNSLPVISIYKLQVHIFFSLFQPAIKHALISKLLYFAFRHTIHFLCIGNMIPFSPYFKKSTFRLAFSLSKIYSISLTWRNFLQFYNLLFLPSLHLYWLL